MKESGGLLSSRRLARQMGGDLGLYPRSRGGARALLLLPVPDAAHPQHDQSALLPTHRQHQVGNPRARSRISGARR